MRRGASTPTKTFTESVVAEVALEWREELGYLVLSGLPIGPGEAGHFPLYHHSKART